MRVFNEAPILCLIPPLITAAVSIMLFFLAGPIIDFLQPVIY